MGIRIIVKILARHRDKIKASWGHAWEVTACTCTLPVRYQFMDEWLTFWAPNKAGVAEFQTLLKRDFQDGRGSQEAGVGAWSTLPWGSLLYYYNIVWKGFLGNHCLFSLTIQVRALRYNTTLSVSVKVTQLAGTVPGLAASSLLYPPGCVCVDRETQPAKTDKLMFKLLFVSTGHFKLVASK